MKINIVLMMIMVFAITMMIMVDDDVNEDVDQGVPQTFFELRLRFWIYGATG